ncbi:hypothetical protein WR25_19852 [Diploscapter pachys]|uniref:26S proteasome non-ATPase regulatory subunit 2 n=1 Tax=Diploscapter pachys TaxID=2018661 RepID=A0A2A2JNK3_9BILA|nr:hypothetical protein WR25_19852 [Diploscapter pachys]
MRHNAEVEACDLLIEIERLDLLKDYVEEPDHGRVCMYLLSCAPLTPDPDNTNLIRTSMEIYIKFGKHFEAVRAAVMLNDTEAITTIFRNTEDKLLRYQMAILLGRHQIFLDFEAMDFLDSEEGSKLNEFNHNCRLHEYFHALARELDIMEPKTPEQVYKSHLEHTRPFGQPANTDTTRMAMANSIVNGMVNCGYSIDKMMAEVEEANKWFHKSKDYGLLTAAASQGLVWRWDVDTGLTQCDRFLYVDSDFVKAGTYLAIGIISSGIQDPCDPAGALLIDHVHSDRPIMRIGSILGLGLAYANSKRETVMKNEEGGIVFELKKILADTKPSATLEVKGLTGLALGMILVATADNTVAMELLQFLMERSEAELQDTNMRFIALGIALIFLGTQEKSDVFVESLKSLPTPFGQMVSTLVDVCSYAGTGNVLKIQNLLHMCSEHYETVDDKKKKKEDAKNAKKEPTKPDLSSQQAVAVLGIGLIAMGEDIGSQMALRMFGHLIRYGEPVIRRAVPLALSLLSVSNPQLNILETLSKFSHDADPDTAHNAIFAMGLVGAGTNNARLVAMLRQLASYHHKDQVSLMLVRIAQGMTHLGKGTMTLSPFHSDRQLLCPSALAALFTICFTFLDANNTVLNNKQHYLLYTLVLAIQPRMLVTLIEDDQKPGSLKQISVSVRVGQAVDVVAQAGKPKTITGFQTHTTPVLLAYGERAELATEEYISLTPYLEGLVILKKNPEYEAAKPTDKKKEYCNPFLIIVSQMADDVDEVQMSDDDSEGNDTQLQMDPHFVVDIVEQRVRILQNRPDDNDDNYVCLEKISVEEYETFGQLWTDDTGYEYDDDYIFCEHPDCETYYFGSCREHPLFLVKDRESNRNGLRARNTIPAFLRIKKSEMPNAGLGVYANTFIPIGIVFGPFEGVLVNDESKVERDGYAWQIRGKDPNNPLFLDASDEHYSNWMRYINSPYG